MWHGSTDTRQWRLVWLIDEIAFSYVGDWNHDKCSGYGQYLHADGTIQKGEWKDNL
jgi:hypothetical protein